AINYYYIKIFRLSILLQKFLIKNTDRTEIITMLDLFDNIISTIQIYP
ncbi:hypothetical protein DF186_20740, partial [Enterococcus hirae]